jgi:hypothetical protein
MPSSVGDKEDNTSQPQERANSASKDLLITILKLE